MMMFLQLTLLTLLIASPGSLISAENVITCGRNVQRLACESGVISVQSAFYGRTSSAICRENNPPSQLANTRCSSRITAIAERCNGQKVCEFNAGIVGTFDPCPGTAKYFDTTYTCIKRRTATICDNSYKTLSCGSTAIKVFNAIYGRSDRTTCAGGLQNCFSQNTKCYANARSRVASMCDGRTTCTVFSSQANFPDPCPGTAKYLKVSYTCIIKKEVVACEHRNALLTCGQGTIRVLSANYGRTDRRTCIRGRKFFFFLFFNTRCYKGDSTFRVMNRCNGKKSCVVPATNAFFSDPCYGTYKYLKVSYACE